ncbi:MAG: hypothetical protein KBS94_03765 [Prevotella sp.]|nr:hypothetical protein [Candidatus Equicola faecalis]
MGKYLVAITIIGIVTIFLSCSCSTNRQSINLMDIGKTDSILYIRLHDDSIKNNTHYMGAIRDSIYIKNRRTIDFIIRTLNHHTDKCVCKHPPIYRFIVFYVGDEKRTIGIWNGGIAYQGEYKSDIDFVDYMEKIFNK